MFVLGLVVCAVGLMAAGIYAGDWMPVVVGLGILAPIALILFNQQRRQPTKEDLIERFVDQHDKDPK